MTDDPLTVHEECGGPVVKVFSSAGIVLKGSGFYKTDTRSQSASTKSAAKSDSAPTEKKSESTPEKKPASTPTPSPKTSTPKESK